LAWNIDAAARIFGENPANLRTYISNHITNSTLYTTGIAAGARAEFRAISGRAVYMVAKGILQIY
jgi:hypothetical protein